MDNDYEVVSELVNAEWGWKKRIVLEWFDNGSVTRAYASVQHLEDDAGAWIKEDDLCLNDVAEIDWVIEALQKAKARALEIEA